MPTEQPASQTVMNKAIARFILPPFTVKRGAKASLRSIGKIGSVVRSVASSWKAQGREIFAHAFRDKTYHRQSQQIKDAKIRYRGERVLPLFLATNDKIEGEDRARRIIRTDRHKKHKWIHGRNGAPHSTDPYPHAHELTP